MTIRLLTYDKFNEVTRLEKNLFRSDFFGKLYEMLIAIKNAKKKKEGDETQNDPEAEAESDVAGYNPNILAKPTVSRRDLRIGSQGAPLDDTPNSRQSESVETAPDEEELSKK